MRAKLAALSAENKRLRRIAHKSRQEALLQRVTIDAQQLLIWRYSGFSVSRRNAEEMGMTQRRWTWARALLQYARVHDESDVTCDEFDTAVNALNSAVKYLSQYGLESLRMRLPQHVLLANVAAKAVANRVAYPAANKHVKKLASSRENAAVRGGSEQWGNRDRRREIEQRLGVNQ